MTNTISAAANPALANNLLNEAFNEGPTEPVEATITPPSDTTVQLPGGYITASGELLRTAEVRELTGKDEEAISKASSVGKALLTILDRGIVSVGDTKASESALNFMLAADRETILLGILKVTFGKTANIPTYCSGCNDFKTVAVDLDEDVKIKILANPIEDRVFMVEGKKGPIKVQLPTGLAQKELINNADKTAAELNTILLEKTVLEINGAPVYNKIQVQNLGVVDRKKILEEISLRSPGPQFNDIQLPCSDCEGEVTVSINLGTLFQF
jgi:hypothetical protein